jgi:hypothetical protein
MKREIWLFSFWKMRLTDDLGMPTAFFPRLKGVDSRGVLRLPPTSLPSLPELQVAVLIHEWLPSEVA